MNLMAKQGTVRPTKRFGTPHKALTGLALTGAVILCAVASAEAQNSDGVYRIPYENGTTVRISRDFLTHTPLGRIDIVGTAGSEFQIVAAADGIVRYVVDNFSAQIDSDSGQPCTNNYVWIEHANGEWTKYSHMQKDSSTTKAKIKVGQKVKAGTYLGDEGQVGCASGDHLHFEVGVPRATNPITTVGGFLVDNDGSQRNRVPRICGIPGGIFVGGARHVAQDVPGLSPTSAVGTTSGFDDTFAAPSCNPTITAFTASPVLVSPPAASTLSWSVLGGASLTLNGVAVSRPIGSQVVNPSAATSYTLVAADSWGSTSRTVTVSVDNGTAGLGTPTVTSPGSGQTVVVTGVGFTWSTVGGATGYDIRVLDASTGGLLFSGSLLGGASNSTLISLPAGTYRFAVRACSGGFALSQCGGYGTVSFTVSPAAPTGVPTVTFPTQGANLTSSTQTLAWTAVTPNPALSGLTYEVLLRDLTAKTTALQITVPSSDLSTIFTMTSSTQYELKVRACQAGCGPYSIAVTFAVSLPPVPVSAPTGVSCSVGGGNSLTCNWNAVTNADAYQVQVVQAPPAGPGGGALTAAAKQVSAPTVTLPVPAGAATVFIAACNGDGCGPNTTVGITAAGPNPSQANIGTPMAGTVVAGPGVLFTWNRVPGDNGSNTFYRLFVQDLSRQATALDVFTTRNFYSAYFKAEGARYDALVVSNPGLGTQVVGPSQGFNVAGASATSPTLVSPPHNSTVTSGNIQLGWSPVPGATLYEYFVAVLGQGSPSARGVTSGLLAQVPLTGTGVGTVYSGIVRACPAGATCLSGSDLGWDPWSNAPGGPGVTNFTVTP